MKKHYIIEISLTICFIMTFNSFSQTKINRIPNFNRIKEEVSFLISKETYLKKVVAGEKLYKFQSDNTQTYTQEIVALKNEGRLITFDVTNTSLKTQEYKIGTNISSSWQVKMYVEETVIDWYSYHKKNRSVTYWGDPLFELKKENKEFNLTVSPKETKRIIVKFTPNKKYKGSIKLTLGSTESSKKEMLRVPLNVVDVSLPKSNFSSVIFNGNSVNSNSFFMDMWQDSYLTHLQVNFVPTVYFDKLGNPVSAIDKGTAHSTGFRNTADLWIKRGGKVMLFWQPRLKIIAPLKQGGYLQPFTKEWKNAFSNLLKIIISNYKKQSPNFYEGQISIYLIDEVSSIKRKEDNNNFINLSQYLEKHNPKIKTMVTYGFYSTEKDLKQLYPNSNIAAMHYTMPEKLEKKGQTFHPKKLKSTLQKIKKINKTNWYYDVERGIATNIKKFLVNPLVGASEGYSGFSWWAFASHRGSTWSNNIKNGLNYSMYYRREDDSNIYKTLSKYTDTSKKALLSLRLLAIEQGLKNAGLIQFIKENHAKLPYSKHKKISEVVNYLQNNDPSQVSLERLQEIDNLLRTIVVDIETKR